MRFIFFFSGFLFYAIASAQALSPRYSVSASGHFGFILPHHNDMRYLISAHTPGAEVNWFTSPRSCSDENNCLLVLPERGIGLLFFDFGNPRQLGKGFAVSPYLNFRINRSETFYLLFRVGSGIGWITEPFDRVENHKNNVIGSNLNGFMNLRLNSYCILSDRLRLEGGIGVAHFSNGAFTLPNLGINLVTINAGLAMGFGRSAEDISMNESYSPFTRTKYFISYLNFGLKEVNTPGGKKYPCVNFSLNREKRITQSGKYSYGIELTYNGANYADFLYDTIPITHARNMQAAVKAGYAVVVGKLSLPMEMGVYLYSLEKGNGPVFHRIGLRYQVSPAWHICYTLKTHWAKADFIEFGLGYMFHVKNDMN
ncbi:MAG: acyloxyacyl hydrolase [Bacteroidota bacterium]